MVVGIATDGLVGVVRKLLGLSFLGETRGGEHWVIADVRVKGIAIDANVSTYLHHPKFRAKVITVLAYVGGF